MKIFFPIYIIQMGFFLLPCQSYAQEEEPVINVEESAEVFLEQYSDDFQESFFEALKQKGIENYDRAINLLLECKRLDPNNTVVDHELAKAYTSNKQYNLARDYGVAALISQPENQWYLNTLVFALEKQGSSFEDLDLSIFSDNVKLQENLALIYYKKGKLDSALIILQKLKKSPFLADLESKINNSIEKRDKNAETATFTTTGRNTSDPTQNYKMRIEGLIRTNNLFMLKQVAEEAIETFPSQPYFYYAQGYALNKTNNHRDAIEVLEAALDYLVGDIKLENKIYTELVEAYNRVNNSVKANMYLRKIKPGF
jgi:tetratricopeptide (TPR) repeat protein